MSWAITAAVVMGGMTANSIAQQNRALTKQQQALADAANLNMQMEQQKEADIKAKTSMELTQDERIKVSEQSSMRAAAAESGVAGISPLRNLTNIYVQHSLNKGSIITNEEMELYSSSLGNINTYAQTASGINQAQGQKTTGFEALAQISMAAAGGYMAAGGTVGGGGTLKTGAGVTEKIAASDVTAANLAKWGTDFTANPVYGSTALGHTLIGLSNSRGRK